MVRSLRMTFINSRSHCHLWPFSNMLFFEGLFPIYSHRSCVIALSCHYLEVCLFGVVWLLCPAITMRFVLLELCDCSVVPLSWGLSSRSRVIALSYHYLEVCPPGAIRDASSSFMWSMALAAGMQLSLAVLWLLMPLATRVDLRRHEKRQQSLTKQPELHWRIKNLIYFTFR